MNIFNLDKTKYLGKEVAERDGVKGILETWEKFTAMDEFNEKIDETIAKLQAKKVDDKLAVGVSLDEVAVK